MVIILVHWKIRIDEASQHAFKEHWSQVSDPGDRSEIIGEFLCRPMSAEEAGFLCGDLGIGYAALYASYFNVGLWESVEAFEAQIINPYVGKGTNKLPFEYEDRERMILQPQHWRMGLGSLPIGDALT